MENKDLLKQVAENYVLRLKREVDANCNEGFFTFELIPIEKYSEEPTCVYTWKRRNFTIYTKDLLIDENGVSESFCLENDWVSPEELYQNEKKREEDKEIKQTISQHSSDNETPTPLPK